MGIGLFIALKLHAELSEIAKRSYCGSSCLRVDLFSTVKSAQCLPFGSIMNEFFKPVIHFYFVPDLREPPLCSDLIHVMTNLSRKYFSAGEVTFLVDVTKYPTKGQPKVARECLT